MEEIWKDVVVDKEEKDKYKGIYKVSNLGRIKYLDYKGEGKVKIYDNKPRWYNENKNEYRHIKLYKDGEKKIYKVHRLVALAFIPNPNNYPVVNHKDENKSNNRVDNLEWCTIDYNNKYGTKIERIIKKNSKKVYQYSKNGELIKIWNSIAECGKEGFNSWNISGCCNGRCKTSEGYIWSFVPIKNKSKRNGFNIEV